MVICWTVVVGVRGVCEKGARFRDLWPNRSRANTGRNTPVTRRAPRNRVLPALRRAHDALLDYGGDWKQSFRDLIAASVWKANWTKRRGNICCAKLMLGGIREIENIPFEIIMTSLCLDEHTQTESASQPTMQHTRTNMPQ